MKVLYEHGQITSRTRWYEEADKQVNTLPSKAGKPVKI
jgi:hypothetical protein